MEDKELVNSLYINSLKPQELYFTNTTLNSKVALSYAGKDGIIMVIDSQITKDEVYFSVPHYYYQEFNFVGEKPFRLEYTGKVIVRNPELFYKILEKYGEKIFGGKPLKDSLVLIEDENELKTNLSKLEGKYLFRGEGTSNADETLNLIQTFLDQGGFGKKVDEEKVKQLKITYSSAPMFGPKDKLKSLCENVN